VICDIEGRISDKMGLFMDDVKLCESIWEQP